MEPTNLDPKEHKALQVNLTGDDIRIQACACGNNIFTPCLMLGRVPGILVGEQGDRYVVSDTGLFRCTDCGRVGSLTGFRDSTETKPGDAESAPETEPEDGSGVPS